MEENNTEEQIIFYENFKKLAVERIYYGRPMTYVVTMARISGLVTKGHLSAIVNKLIKKHQLLKVRIVLNVDNEAYFSQKNVKEFDICEVKKIDDDQWQQISEKEHKRFFNTSKGPLIRFTLLQSTKDTDLVICAHHSISDGLSLIELVQDIVRCLNNEKHLFTQKSTPPEINEELLNAKIGNLKNRTLLKIINWFWKRKKIRFTSEDIKKLHKKYWEINKGPIVIGWKIPPQKTLKIIERSREEKVTVHSLLISVFLKAQQEIQKGKNNCHNYFHMPVDMRKKLNMDKRLGFYAVSLILKHKFDRKRAFWDETRILHRKIKNEMQSADLTRLYTINLLEPTLLDSTYFQVYGLFNSKISKLIIKAMGIDKRIAGIAITNLGRLKEINSNFKKYQLLEIYGPSVYSDLLEKVVSVLTYNDIMYFTMTAEKATVEEKVVKEVKEKAMNLLNEILFDYE